MRNSTKKLFMEAKRAQVSLEAAIFNLGDAVRVIVQNPMDITPDMVTEWEADVMRVIADKYNLPFPDDLREAIDNVNVIRARQEVDRQTALLATAKKNLVSLLGEDENS